MRDLEQDARAVAGVDLRPACAAVLESVEDVERAFDGAVARVAGQAGNRADAAVVVLEVRVVEAHGLRSLKTMHMGGPAVGPLRAYGGEEGILAAGEAEKTALVRFFSAYPPWRRRNRFGGV